jgi:hypothetical protein
LTNPNLLHTFKFLHPSFTLSVPLKELPKPSKRIFTLLLNFIQKAWKIAYKIEDDQTKEKKYLHIMLWNIFQYESSKSIDYGDVHFTFVTEANNRRRVSYRNNGTNVRQLELEKDNSQKLAFDRNNFTSELAKGNIKLETQVKSTYLWMFQLDPSDRQFEDETVSHLIRK